MWQTLEQDLKQQVGHAEMGSGLYASKYMLVRIMGYVQQSTTLLKEKQFLLATK